MSGIEFIEHEGVVMVSSLTVAGKFGKMHKNVLRSIRELRVDNEFWRRNFKIRSNIDSIGKSQPVILMTHDGFKLIVMGFTGAKAVEWKVKFIEAFNEMEERCNKEDQPDECVSEASEEEVTNNEENDDMKTTTISSLTGLTTAKSDKPAPLPIVSLFKLGNEEVNSVNLRDVHAFLGSKQDFSNWAKNRLEDFVEDVDFISFNKTIEAVDIKGLPTYKTMKEYVVTIDTAKHISMVERNEKGKQLRQYFIDCEKKLLATPKAEKAEFALPSNYVEALEALLASEKSRQIVEAEVVQVKQVIEVQAPKVEAWDKYMSSDGLLSMNDAAKVLGTGRNTLFEDLRAAGIFTGTSPKQAYVNQGLFIVKVIATGQWEGSVTKVTPKGLEWLAKGNWRA